MVMPASSYSIMLNDIRITYVPDGYILFDRTALFPTTTLANWQSYQRLLDSDGQIVGSIGAYVIQTPNHTLLVDAGYGPRSLEQGPYKVYGGKLLSSLKLAGLDPTDIDHVFFTHLHSDHVGWAGQNVNGARLLTFPNARHLIRRSEWHKFDNPTERRASVEEELKLLKDRIEFVEDGEQITPNVTILATPGHTIGHASVLVTAGEQRAILLGDTFHSVAQFEHPEWTNTFDRDPEQAKVTRQRMLQELAEPSTIGIGTHFSESVFGRLLSEQDRLQWHILQ